MFCWGLASNKEGPMAYSRMLLGTPFLAWLLATAFAPFADGQPAAPECNSIDAAASPRCAHFLQETTRLHYLALAIERIGNAKLARDTYSQAVESANRPIDLFLAGTVPAAALLRRGMMHREVGQPAEAMADFTALVVADKGNSEAHYERARTLFDLGRLNDALADADAAAWLKPHTSDFHALRAQILNRLDRHDEAAAASIEAEKYAAGRLKVTGLSKQQLEELAANRNVQELVLALHGIAPFVPQRFSLQRQRQDDDRHVLVIRLDRGRA